jgi:hypothetical protein
MATYRLLEDHSIGGGYLEAGTVVSTADVGGILPVNWVPTGNCDPLDASAVTAFWNVGPQLCRLARQQWSTQVIDPPLVYWKSVGQGAYALTSAGASLGTKCVGGLSLP